MLIDRYQDPDPSTNLLNRLIMPCGCALTLFLRTYRLCLTGDVTGELLGFLAMCYRVWDGRDDQGRMVASGIYLARLRAGPYHENLYGFS